MGIEPLATLVEYCFEQSLPKGAVIHIEHERTSKPGGRIDLLIRFNDSMALGIENKVFANEGLGQTSS